ncbi:13915_t:CDS:2, partial [Cetraspora pellucida]
QSNMSESDHKPSKRIKTKKVSEITKDLLGVDELEFANISYKKDDSQADQSLSDKSYEDEKTEDSTKGVRNCGRGSKNKGNNTCNTRKACSTKHDVHIVSDNDNGEEDN